eukprot:TRINITY_DN1528_c0_g1_i1.p1 TRINITY_DN1528_c0_g1~~TRINITY_DN1528_c0_g1_i1.p1  ORF type:complete len:328 (+),score=92.17 TRINITY_DN1528_c0_g1_i1:69-1052(+)
MAGLTLFVQSHTGTKHPVDLLPTATVADLRQAAEEAGAGTALVYQGERLTDDQMMLADLGICPEAVVEASLRSATTLVFDNMSSHYSKLSNCAIVRKLGMHGYGCAQASTVIKEGRHLWSLQVRLGQAGTTNFCIGVVRAGASVDINLSSCTGTALCIIDHAFSAKSGDIFTMLLDADEAKMKWWHNSTLHESPYISSSMDLAGAIADGGVVPVIGSWGAADRSGDGCEIIECPILEKCLPAGTANAIVYAPVTPERTPGFLDVEQIAAAENRMCSSATSSCADTETDDDDAAAPAPPPTLPKHKHFDPFSTAAPAKKKEHGRCCIQ